MKNLKPIFRIIILTIIITSHYSCGTNKKELPSSETEPMTEKEYIILSKKDKYFQGKLSIDTPEETVNWIREFYSSVEDSEVESNQECHSLSINEIIELSKTQSKSKFLRNKNFILNSFSVDQKGALRSHEQVKNSDFVTFGKCLTPVLRNDGGHHFISALVSMKPNMNFRISITVNNMNDSQVKILIDKIIIGEFEKIYNEVVTSGKIASSKELNIKNAYLFADLYWEFTGNSLIVVTPKID